MTRTPGTIPAFVNKASGTADAALDALRAAPEFDVRPVAPDELQQAIQAAVDEGAARVLVAGGDGSIGTAAAILRGRDTELAVLPGGTLNHFARDLNIPTEAEQALRVATHGSARSVDVAIVNDHVFLNTSSVGMYVRFVRMREYLEHHHVGYRLASLLAAFRLLFQFKRITVKLEVDGKEHIYRTPLVFIGLGERELKFPTLGNRVPHGKEGLHVMVVRGRTGARAVAVGLSAIARGVSTVATTPELDSFIVEKCTITRGHRGFVAVDGELVPLAETLEYELKRGVLRVVCP